MRAWIRDSPGAADVGSGLQGVEDRRIRDGTLPEQVARRFLRSDRGTDVVELFAHDRGALVHDVGGHRRRDPVVVRRRKRMR